MNGYKWDKAMEEAERLEKERGFRTIWRYGIPIAQERINNLWIDIKKEASNETTNKD